MAIEGTIRIHRSIGGTGAAFRVSFVPYDADGESTASVRSFHEVQQERAFLKSLGVPTQIPADAFRQLAAGRPASLPSVSLDQNEMKDAGLAAPILPKPNPRY